MDRQLSPADHPAFLPYQRRVLNEAAELGDRLARLRAFMQSKEFAAAPAMERVLLRVQEGQMAALRVTLHARAELFNEQRWAQARGGL